MRVFNISSGLFVRFIFTISSILSVWRVVSTTGYDIYWLLLFFNVLLYVEAIFTFTHRKKGEWKWFCPSVAIYLLMAIPCVWITEINLLNQRVSFTSHTGSRHCADSDDVFINASGFQAVSVRGLELNIPLTLTANAWSLALQQVLLFVLIICRWMLPKGELTRDQLSQLLLVYIGIAADILEFSTEGLKMKETRCDIQMVFWILAIWTWSLLQFTLGLTVTKSRKPRVATSLNEPRMNIMCCETEVWGIMATVVMQDGPFLALRLYVLVYLRAINQMMIFFTCKNTLVALLQFYRLIVIFIEKPGSNPNSLIAKIQRYRHPGMRYHTGDDPIRRRRRGMPVERDASTNKLLTLDVEAASSGHFMPLLTPDGTLRHSVNMSRPEELFAHTPRMPERFPPDDTCFVVGRTLSNDVPFIPIRDELGVCDSPTGTHSSDYENLHTPYGSVPNDNGELNHHIMIPDHPERDIPHTVFDDTDDDDDDLEKPDEEEENDITVKEAKEDENCKFDIVNEEIDKMKEEKKKSKKKKDKKKDDKKKDVKKKDDKKKDDKKDDKKKEDKKKEDKKKEDKKDDKKKEDKKKDDKIKDDKKKEDKKKDDKIKDEKKKDVKKKDDDKKVDKRKDDKKKDDKKKDDKKKDDKKKDDEKKDGKNDDKNDDKIKEGKINTNDERNEDKKLNEKSDDKKKQDKQKNAPNKEDKRKSKSKKDNKAEVQPLPLSPLSLLQTRPPQSRPPQSPPPQSPPPQYPATQSPPPQYPATQSLPLQSLPKSPPKSPLPQSPPKYPLTPSPPKYSMPQSSPISSLPQSPPKSSLPQSPPKPLLPQSPPKSSMPQSPPKSSMPQSSPKSPLPQYPPKFSMPQSPPKYSMPQSPPKSSLQQSPSKLLLPQSPPKSSMPQSPPKSSMPQSSPKSPLVPQSPPKFSMPHSPLKSSMPQSPPKSSLQQSPPKLLLPQSLPKSSMPQSPPKSPLPQSSPKSLLPQSPPKSSVPQSPPKSPSRTAALVNLNDL